jgi:hypothetical protein
MRVTTCLVAFALCACLSALPTNANDGPWAHLDGLRCDRSRDGSDTTNGSDPGLIVCQIVDDGVPTGTRRTHPIGPFPIAPTLDSLRHLLSTLNHASHDSSPRHHDTNTTPPATP